MQQQNPNRLPSHLRHQFSLHRFFGHQANRPAGATWWRIATDHRDDPLLLVRIQHLGRAGPLFLVIGAIQADLLIAMAEASAMVIVPAVCDKVGRICTPITSPPLYLAVKMPFA